MDQHDLALLVIAAGLLVIVLGVLRWLGGLNWFGRLPGDIRIERRTSESTRRSFRCCWCRWA